MPQWAARWPTAVAGLCVLAVVLSLPGAADRGPGRSAATGSALCLDPVRGRTWRVDWQRGDSPFGVLYRPIGFFRRQQGRPSGAWQDVGDTAWQLRYRGEVTRSGDLAVLAQVPVAEYLSPRYVTPDGSCSVYVAPYVNATDDRLPVGAPRFAFIGDSLLASLDEPSLAAEHTQGRLEALANPAGARVEADGQPGRRWVAEGGADGSDGSDGSAQAAANTTMLDEIRGLRTADVQVIALGANDGNWVAAAADTADRDRRLDLTAQRLGEILDEIGDAGRCTVLVTVAARTNTHDRHGWYPLATTRVNAVLRAWADADRDDGLRLDDWGPRATEHPEFFGADGLHLSEAGRRAYAEELFAAASEAASAC
jgi:lysophospholipase L1-like esterase